MLVHLDLQVGLVPHLLPKQIGEHGVRAAAVIGQVDGIQVWMVGHELGPGQDVLAKGPVQIGVVLRQIQVVGGQVGQGDDLMPALQQQPGNTHVEHRIGKAVVPGNEYQHLVVRSEGRQQFLPLLLHRRGMPPHRFGPGQQGGQAARLWYSQLLPDAQHGGGHCLLSKVQVEHRAEQGDSPPLQIQGIGRQPGRGLHIDTAIIVLYMGGLVLHGVDRGHEDIVHALFRQPCHVAVEQLHRVTGLRLGSLLGQPDDLLICGRREQDIESQVPEKCICHGEEFVDHQRIGDAHHLFPWDPDGVIPLQQQRPRPLVEGDVLRHPWPGGVFRPGRCVKSVEAGRAAD